MATMTASTQPVSNSHPFYIRVAALGFLLMTLGVLIPFVPALIRGEVGDPLFLLFLGIPLLLAVLVWRFGSWALVLAVILGLLMLLSAVGFGVLFVLGHPESFLDFVPSVLLTVGSLMGVVGAIVALVQRRRGTARAEASPSERRAVQMILAALGVLVLLSGVLTLTGRPAIPAEAKAGAAQVQIKNFSFSPGQLEVKAGESVCLVVSNADAALHTFTIRELGVDASIAPGNEALIEFRAPDAGIYTWVCIPHESEMKGTLVVK